MAPARHPDPRDPSPPLAAPVARALAEVRDALDSGVRLLVLVGGTGSGKTLVLDELAATAPVGVARADGDGFDQSAGFTAGWLLIDDAFLLDDDALDDLADRASMDGGPAVVLAGLRRGIGRLRQRVRPRVIELAPLERAEARRFVEAVVERAGHPALGAEAVDALVDSADGSVRALCETTIAATERATDETGGVDQATTNVVAGPAGSNADDPRDTPTTIPARRRSARLIASPLFKLALLALLALLVLATAMVLPLLSLALRSRDVPASGPTTEILARAAAPPVAATAVAGTAPPPAPPATVAPEPAVIEDVPPSAETTAQSVAIERDAAPGELGQRLH